MRNYTSVYGKSIMPRHNCVWNRLCATQRIPFRFRDIRRRL